MKIFQIVLTGGPGAGKTTILESISKKLQNLGFKIIVVPETARSFIANGIIPNNNYDYTMQFQDAILKEQKLREELSEYFAKIEAQNNNVIILYDRGIFDNCAYLNDFSDFKTIMNNNNLKELNTIEKYDLVLDLISPATCFQDFYTTDSERFESAEEAVFRDKRTSDAWLLNQNLKIVLPTETIEEKESVVMHHILDLIKSKREISTNTYPLTRENRENILNNLDNNTSRTLTITKAYLEMPNGANTLIHQEYNNEHSFSKESYVYKDSELDYHYETLNSDEYHDILNSKYCVHSETTLETRFIKDFKLYKLLLKNGLNYLEEYKNIYQLNNNVMRLVKK